MARIEKTVFISYRRKDISWALAVYQYLTSQKYDVFFDFSSLSSGDFEQVIISNIRARAHFILILTPTALDRCNQPGDWLRREIETAIDEKRNIIPLFFDGFSFGSPSIKEKLTGKLGAINRYNGLDIPSGYFMEAMERLRSRYLNVPLNAVLHPVPTEVKRVVKEEKVAADKALIQKREDIKELVKSAEEKSIDQEQVEKKKTTSPFSLFKKSLESICKPFNLRNYGIGASVLLIAIIGVYSIWQNYSTGNATPPATVGTMVMTSTKTIMPMTATSTSTMTSEPPPPTSALGILPGGFKVIHYYQNDPRWANEMMGNSTETIGSWGSLLTTLANLLSGYGYYETPLTLNEKMKESGGYQGAFINLSILPFISPNIVSVDSQSFEAFPAPVAEINTSLDAGQPVVLQVDWNKEAGIQSHFVMAYMRKGNDYLILDPYQYDGDTPDEEILLTERYNFNGGTLEQEISSVLWIRYTGK